MPPLTLAILASALHLQGADATITSDNKGIDELLAPLRQEFQQNVDPNSPRIAAVSHQRGWYLKTYTRHYLMHYFGSPGSGTAIKPSGGTGRPQGGKRR